jgi:microcystin-dependent protein
MAVNLSPIGNSEQFFDNNGIPLNGGLLYTYQAGSSTPLATYTDINGTIANTNPIVLNTAGRLANEVWLTYGFNYKFVLKDSSGVTIGTYDNIYGMVGVQTAVGTTIPAGMISLWYGSLGSIPTGWYLCDGSNGTPDLRDRFIVGAGSTYSVGATGGSTTHTITTSEMPSHTHNATSVVTDPGHNHTLNTVFGFDNTTPSVTVAARSTGATQSNIVTNTATTGITVATTNATTGSGTAFNILNPYYALAYVMKA